MGPILSPMAGLDLTIPMMGIPWVPMGLQRSKNSRTRDFHKIMCFFGFFTCIYFTIVEVDSSDFV
jgi:hypothetical protein